MKPPISANPYFFMVDTTGQQLPYINEMDELYANDQEVRLLKLVNGEVDYKAQSLQLSDAPLMLENQEKGGYTIQLKPRIAMQAISFNVTHEDEAKRAVFGDVRFRKAMSEAINRDALNETAYFGQGTLQQYTGFSPLPEFVDQSWKTYAMEYNVEGTKAVLDELGLKDTNGDGFRELPNGAPLVLNMQFATQGIAGQVVELISQDWAAVGIKSAVKEVTPDEYRSAQSSNQLDVGLWEKGQPLGIILGNNELWVPPFENYFAHRSGMKWAEWVDSKGASGIEPPDYVKTLMADINALQSTPAGTDEFKVIANRMVAAMVENVLFIGTALTPDPIYFNNDVKNVPEFKTASYEYYRAFPYRPSQWFLEE